MQSLQSIEGRVREALAPFLPLFEKFEAAGFELYAVGGCVRDWALGATPKDIDFTTDALPEQTREVLASNGYKVIPVGEVFGTIATVIGHKNYEITTYRVKESYTRGSRHPIVCFGKSLALDLERRDLTINAMAAGRDGTIVDPFDGLGDLEKGLLRVPHSSYEKTLEIFSDDPLRILRLARFKARLGFDVCRETTMAARDMAGSVLGVSHERWFAEIDGMLRARDPQSGMDWLCEIGVWQMLFPEFVPLMDAKVEPQMLSESHAREGNETLWAQTIRRVRSSVADDDGRWVALFSLLGYSTTLDTVWASAVTRMMAEQIMVRLKFSNARCDAVMKRLTMLPPGKPTYRTARELAISLGDQILSWIESVAVCCGTLEENRNAEDERLGLWKDALAPYIADPKSAEVQLPAGLSQRLSADLGVRGKTLGLCITHCREAVLDQQLRENDDVERFVEWVRTHFDA